MVFESLQASGFDELYGLELDSVDERRVTGHVVITDRHLQPFGLVHGGVYAAMAEALASIGASVAASSAEPGTAAVGLENHTSFLHGVGEGTRVDAEAVVHHAGRRVQHWTVTMRDAASGRELALSTVRLAVIQQRLTRPL